jgi:nitrite reductase/ring-hydroxylating ferredoxin subunit
MDGPVPVHGYLAMLIEKVKTMDVKTYTVTVEGDNIFVDV